MFGLAGVSFDQGLWVSDGLENGVGFGAATFKGCGCGVWGWELGS